MPLNPQRGEVWYIVLDPTVGAEIRKTRPCVVISDSDIGILPLRLIVPLTTWQGTFAGYSWQVKIEATPGSGLSKTSAADVFQMRSVSLARFASAGPTGILPAESLAAIVEALAFIVAYAPDAEG